MTPSSVLFEAGAIFAGLFFLCVYHNGHRLFGIGYHLKIFSSQVATGKKVNFMPWLGILISQIDPRISTSYRFKSRLIITTYHLIFPRGMIPFLILFLQLLNDTSQNPEKKPGLSKTMLLDLVNS